MRGGRIIGGALLGAAAAALLAAPAASADAQIVAGFGNTFVVSEGTIDQGGKVTFQNNDTVDHDVTSNGKAPDGKRLFASPRTAPATTSNVDGTQYLTTGDYGFFCSIHPFMTGTLHVTAAGTPQPRPGGGGGPGGDTKPPSVDLKVLDVRVSKVRHRHGLRVRVTTDEAATVSITARAGGTKVATGSAKLGGAGSKTAKLKLTRAGRRLVRRARRLRLSLSATGKDPTGNSDTRRFSASLRR